MTTSKSVRLGLLQMACSADPAANLENIESQMRAAAADGAQIICLQELCTSQYFCTVESEKFFELAEPANGPTVSRLSKVAKELEVVVVIPFFEKRAPGVYHNSAVVVDADGSSLGTYRKMHIPDDPLYYEKYFFTPGDSDGEQNGYRIFKTRYANIGVLICWDQWYPEAARITSLMGAEILFYPTAIGWHPFEKEKEGEAQWNAWQTMQRSHAIANGVFVAAVNRVGHEETEGTDGIEFYGRSFVANPFGKVLAQGETGKADRLTVDCNLEEIEVVRQQWPFYRDRRIDSYTPITKRLID